jgi:hypothetical protein
VSYYVAPFTFDFVTSSIDVDSGFVTVSCIDLYNAIKEAQASQEGIIYDKIATASGLQDLGGGVLVGITVELLANWQLNFPAGNYIAKVSGGNLVGGPGGDPIAYSAGVQTLLIQSAASTVVNTSGGGSDPWDSVIESGYTAGEILKVLAAFAAGKTSITSLGGGDATVIFRDLGDTTDRIEAGMTGSERTTITLDTV